MSVAEELFNRLGLEFQEDDEVLQVIFSAVAPPLETAITAIENVGQNFDPNTCPDSWLDYWLYVMRWPVESSFTFWQKREILKRLPDWRKRYGQPETATQTNVIEEIIKLYFRPTVSNIGLDIKLSPRISTVGGLRIGKGRIGRARVWNRYSRNYILVSVTNYNDVTNNTETHQRLALFLDKLLPAFQVGQMVGIGGGGLLIG